MDPVTLALAKSWAEGQFGDLRELGPHIEAILDSRIVEHNLDVADPPNGWYVRWEHGLQVCWVIDFILSTLAGGGTRLQNTWTYPAAFASKPFVVLNFDAANFSNWEQVWHWRAQRATATSVTVHAAKDGAATFASGDEVQVGVFAMGFWKREG